MRKAYHCGGIHHDMFFYMLVVEKEGLYDIMLDDMICCILVPSLKNMSELMTEKLVKCVEE